MVKLPAGMGIMGGSMTRSLIVLFLAGSPYAPPRFVVQFRSTVTYRRPRRPAGKARD
jgi:hypothetical protein